MHVAFKIEIKIVQQEEKLSSSLDCSVQVFSKVVRVYILKFKYKFIWLKICGKWFYIQSLLINYYEVKF